MSTLAQEWKMEDMREVRGAALPIVSNCRELCRKLFRDKARILVEQRLIDLHCLNRWPLCRYGPTASNQEHSVYDSGEVLSRERLP